MRSPKRFTESTLTLVSSGGSLFAALALLALSSAACSDGGGATPAKLTPPPDAAVTVPPETPARSPITVVVKGHGHVAAIDGSLDCGESGGLDGGSCKATHYGTTLYAAAYLPWAFDHWEPSLSVNPSLQIESWTSDPVTAVFVPLPGSDAGK